MAQVTKYYQPAKPRQQLDSNNINVAVPNANTQIYKVQTLGLSRLFVQISVATNALAAFNIQAQATPDATAATLYSTAADFTAPKGILIGASGDLTTLAAGASGWFILDVTGLAEVTLNATSANAGGSTVTAYVGGA